MAPAAGPGPGPGSGDPDLELCALGDLGLTLVSQGRTSEGLGLIDEAMAGTLGGEHRQLLTVVTACCDMLVACDLAGDLRRAVQWCQVADRFIDRYGCPFLYARCRTLYGGVLVAKGRWEEAEAELQAAIRIAEGPGPASHAEALARLADLRLRRGAWRRPRRCCPSAAAGGRRPGRRRACGWPGRAVGRGRAAGAVHGGRRRPASKASVTQRPRRRWRPWSTRLALGDQAAAAAAVARLAELAEGDGEGQVAAMAPQAAARWRPSRGGPRRPGAAGAGAGPVLQQRPPHETALARVELAHALTGVNPELAVAEARTALGAFERLGAAGDADAADALLRSLGATGRTGPKRIGVLTRREQEVLRLVGLGLSNPEIAQRLFISRKTAAHHVSNVLAKLGVRNRAGAIAYATRQQDRG